MSQRRGRRIEISGSSGLSVHADGEPVSHLPAVFELLPSSLTVAVPQAAANGYVVPGQPARDARQAKAVND